ncbi:tryptophan synthase beta subunit-like PLP-dependent enzyme [Neohortaea acidophila]|uniref:Cysteine synthase 2 n=1 Tax=Neohortaea acidophila TaxID=245834 RepID=A0A6A6PYQ9_9PEZI|nr:tryptophan synthase beta subunit-like PLP-dependent enzyme [Neohortaea acidophila]KAF2485348.1 tryptophan synthase beta subunit-like PLP-dependent enzyme [Neohortaea acidophila]
MAFFTDLWHRIWNTTLDHRNKLTTTGGFLIGIIVTLGFKDFYPDLEASFRQRLRSLRGLSVPQILPGQADYVRLEDHTKQTSSSLHPDALDSRRSWQDAIPEGIEGLIGNTPLIKLKALSEATGCEILGKAEYLNGAGNSPKDRVALSMINLAEEEGLIKPNRGDTIYEGTVGSTGISLAAVCRARGYQAYICMPNDQASEKSELLLRLGATVERVKPASIVDQAQFVNMARKRAREHTENPNKPGKGFFADQFENSANYIAHQTSTGPEIYQQTGGQLDAFVAGAGTGGTISGVALALKPQLPNVKIVLADPQGSGLYNKVKYGVLFSPTEAEGTRRRHQVDSIVEGIGINRLTANFSAGMELIDDAVKVSDVQAMKMARWLVENEGLFLGASSAVNCVAAAELAKRMEPGSRIVTILCDPGSRHLSRFWKAAGELKPEECTFEGILGRD